MQALGKHLRDPIRFRGGRIRMCGQAQPK